MGFDWERELWLITGSSSGLGRALAFEAAKVGSSVVMIARNESRLEEISKKIREIGVDVYYFPFDLGEIDKIPWIYESIIKETGRHPTILINNVGYQAAGYVQNTPCDVYIRSYRVNTLAPVSLIQAVLPEMIKEGKGVIGNVMSSVMYHAFPGVSAYCASKSALGAIHESLKSELTGTGVMTISIRPGGFRSEYWQNTLVEGRIPAFKIPSVENSRDPSVVAKKIIKSIEKGVDVDLSTNKDKIGRHLGYWFPNLLDKLIVFKNRELIEKNPCLMIKE